MKKVFFMALGAGLLLTSCQSDEPILNPGDGQEIETTFTINVPEAMGTRAGEGYVSSANGGLTNVGEDLYYTVALVNQNGKVTWSSNLPDSKNANTATFKTTVVTGYEYKLIAFANFKEDVAPYSVGDVVDTTAASLGKIATNYGLNDEAEDAYYCNTTVKGGPTMEATLRRPFGKLRLVAEDYKEISKLGLSVASIKVTYTDQVDLYQDFNVVTEGFSTMATSKEFTFDGETAYTTEAGKETDGVYTVFVDYLPAPKEGQYFYPFTIEVTYTGATADNFTRTFRQDIPVKRNHLTTLRGNFFTEESALTLTVNEMFAGEAVLDTKYTYFVAKTNDELTAALRSNEEHIYVELDADLTYDVAPWQNNPMGGDKTKSITISGANTLTRSDENRTLTFYQTDSDWNNIVTANGAKLVLKDLKVTNSGHNDGPWNRHDLNFACDVEMENVYSDKAIALKAGGVFKNVTIHDANTSDTYALWIQPKGQTVTLENCEIDMLDCTDGRGIKIDNQYVEAYEEKVVTLNVSGTTFKTEEKSAVIVKTTVGAIINWGEGNDISKVAADPCFAVWVDEATSEHANKVEVNGARIRTEGSEVTAGTQSEIVDAITTANAVVSIKKGTYTFPKNFAAGVTLICEEGTKFTGASNLYINGATVVGATFSNPSGSAASSTINGTFKNCKFEGSNALRWCYAGETVVFENCTFTGDVYGVHFDGGANDATFKNCVISGFNAFGGELTKLTLEGCTFKSNPKCGYNGANLWGSTAMTDCEFTFDGSTSTEWIDCKKVDGVYSFTNCTVNGQPYTSSNYNDDPFNTMIYSSNDVSATINGEKVTLP